MDAFTEPRIHSSKWQCILFCLSIFVRRRLSPRDEFVHSEHFGIAEWTHGWTESITWSLVCSLPGTCWKIWIWQRIMQTFSHTFLYPSWVPLRSEILFSRVSKPLQRIRRQGLCSLWRNNWQFLVAKDVLTIFNVLSKWSIHSLNIFEVTCLSTLSTWLGISFLIIVWRTVSKIN